MFRNYIVRGAVLFFLALLFTGCGSDDASSLSTATIDGVVIDGYWQNAKVCVDVNSNNRCDADEPYVMSGVNGNYSIEVEHEYVNTKNLVAEGVAGQTIDEGLNNGAGGVIDKNTTFMTPATKQYIITPITTLVKQEMDDNKTQEEAENSIAALLGIDVSKVYIDYVETNDTAVANQATRAANAIQSEDNNYTQAIIVLQQEDSNATITADNFTYGSPVGSSAKTFNWKVLSDAKESNGEVLSAVVKTEGFKGVTAISGETMTYAPSMDKNGSDSIVLTINDTLGKSTEITVGVTGIDTVIPVVTSTAPTNGATNTGVNDAVAVTFSKEMNVSSVSTTTGSLKDALGNVVSGTVSSVDNTFTFTPDNNLAYNTTYTATLTTGVKDSVGNALASDYTWSFTTGSSGSSDTTAPTFVSSSPTNGATDVAISSAITLVFSEAILPGSATSSTIILRDSSSNTIASALSFDDTKTIKVTPNSNLSVATGYTLTITTGVTDLAGNALASNQTTAFTTANSSVTTPITANSFTYSTAIGSSQATFNWKTLSSATDPAGGTLSAVVSSQGGKGNAVTNGDSVTYTPSSDKNGTDAFDLNISSTSGSSKVITVTVTGIDTAAVTVTATTPAKDATGVGVCTWLDINFSDPVQSSSITTTTLTIDGGKSVSSVTYDTTTNSARYYIYDLNNTATALDENTTYSVSVKNILGTNGITLTQKDFSFTTGFINKLPRLKTGQTKCYDSSNNVVACDSADALKDDGYYASFSTYSYGRGFERNDTSEIVTDSTTGFMWQDDAAAGTTIADWATANESTCQALNSSSYGGYTDWRLPSIAELVTLVDRAAQDPAIFTGFSNTASDNYWSSTLRAGSSSSAWYNSFVDGNGSYAAVTSSYSIRCVRGEAPATPAYLRDDSNGTVLDTTSGLLWQDNIGSETVTKSWSDAISYCGELTLSGHSDWRLPNYNELYQLTDVNGSISPAVFQYKTDDLYWTSTTYMPDVSKSWYVSFDAGNFKPTDKTHSLNVRCVRGGYIDAPKVSSSTPANGATSIAPDANITVIFSKAIKASSVTDSSVVLKDESNNTVATSKVLTGTQTLVVTPDSNLSKITAYTLSLSTGVTDTAGNPLQNQTAISFTTVRGFYLADNGITIMCGDANIGDTATVNGVTYTKRAKADITVDNAVTTCTSGITDMSNLFASAATFDANISTWDTSSVTTMDSMFKGAEAFNQPLGDWNTSQVTNMQQMFGDAAAFNQDISTWCVPLIDSKPSGFDTGSGFEGDTAKQPNWGCLH